MSDASERSIGPAGVLELASADPRRALDLGSSILDRLPGHDHVGRATTLRALCIAARLGSTMVDSISYGRQSVTEATAADDPELLSRSLMSLAGSVAFSGDNAGAFQILEDASEMAGGLLLAEIEFQRGTLLARIGERKASLACFSRAMPVFEQHHDLESIAMTLHNRAMVQISSGDPIAAEEDLLRAQAIYAEDHSDADVAYADHALA
ncbi:MAG: hypothetical protein ACRDZM_08125, partial [Acidimicrobiia bacterium]